jgi:DNA polymerase III delta subunit
LGTKNWVDSWLEYFILQNSLEFKTKETKQWILKELKDSPHIIKSWITKLIFESNISKITPEHLKTLDIYSLHEDAKQVIIYALNGNVFKCINAVKNMHTSNNSSYGLLIWLTFRFLYCIIELKYTNRNILNNLFLPKNCDDKLLYIAKKISEKNIKKYMSQIEEVDRFNKQANNSSKLVGLLELYKNIAMT